MFTAKLGLRKTLIKFVYEFKVPASLCVIKLVIRVLKPTIKWWKLSRVNQGFIRVRSNKNTHKDN
jgi:hypothetical protein